MYSIPFTEEEIVEVANHTAFTAYHGLDDDDDDAWRVARISVGILDKIEEAYPGLFENENLLCAREIVVLRK